MNQHEYNEKLQKELHRLQAWHDTVSDDLFTHESDCDLDECETCDSIIALLEEIEYSIDRVEERIVEDETR